MPERSVAFSCKQQPSRPRRRAQTDEQEHDRDWSLSTNAVVPASLLVFTQRAAIARARRAHCQAAYRCWNQSTVRLTASGCGVGLNGPNAPSNFDESETNGRSYW